MSELLPDTRDALLVGRAWSAGQNGPCLVAVDGDRLRDVTRLGPTMSQMLEREDLLQQLGDPAQFPELGTIQAFSDGSIEGSDDRLLAPCDLQAIKACGVTFAKSMVERVIEEKAAGDPAAAADVRNRVAAIIGDSLRNLVPGSDEAAAVKRALIEEGLWSQYLEVGIGPDAEIFTKCQPMAAVGWGAPVGLHPVSKWNNPEPEVVLAVDSKGQVRGATLGNDVNLRDVEGRSALLLGKAKDNNASCAIGPFIRLFNDDYGLGDVRGAVLDLFVEGRDGFLLEGRSTMSEISRDPLDLVRQARGRHHQYPDGFMLFMGTLFAPTEDRDVEGEGFTHQIGDIVRISNRELGTLRNEVRLSTECPEWTFGTVALMQNLAARGLL